MKAYMSGFENEYQSGQELVKTQIASQPLFRVLNIVALRMCISSAVLEDTV